MAKILYVFKVSFLNFFSYRAELISGWLIEFVAIGLYLLLWKLITDSQGEVGGYTFDGIAIYYVLIAVASTIKGNRVAKRLEKLIARGELSNIVIKPISTKIYVWVRSFAEELVRFLITLAVVIPVIVCFSGMRDQLVLTTSTVIWLMVFLVLTVCFNLTFYLLIGCLAFWVIRLGGMRNITYQIVSILRGSWFPIDIAPTWFQTMLSFLPFPYVAYYPIKILTSETVFLDNLKGAVVLGVYFLIGLVLVKFAWQFSIKKYSAVGM